MRNAMSPAVPHHSLVLARESLTAQDVSGLRRAIRTPQRLGAGLMIVFLGGFLGWGLTAPIAGGAVAPGIISPDGSRRTVQHLEGGIIAELRVRDGDKVTAGQPLVLLESIQARTTFNTLHLQHLSLLATEARLRAEQQGREAVELPEAVQAALSDPELRRLVETQLGLFASRQFAFQSRTRVLRQRIEQSREQITGYEAQVTSANAQLSLLAEELRGKLQLLQAGLVPRPQVLALMRAQAEIEGRRGEYLGNIARSRQVISEAEMQILSLQADLQDRVAEQLDKARVDLAAVSERLQLSRDILSRTSVTAPISGTVVNLRFRTVEGVIRPGEAILDIVPDEESLLIDARVNPVDIDVVQQGIATQVRLTAFSSRGLPRIQGTVRSVSADRLVDEASGQAYYLARVAVERSELDRLGPGMVLVPGMPAEVLIVRRERTMVQYLLEPFRDAFHRSFREV